MSRHRALARTNVPHPLGALYYRQRASAGLLLAEGTQISPTARGFAGVPGIYTKEQGAVWHVTTEAVHDAGGKIFLQLWHAGRISHHLHQPDGRAPPAPSAIRANAVAVLETGEAVPCDTPRELTKAEVSSVIDDYRGAARNAILAGFDGVEIHGGNGYLIHQFLSAGSNQRSDEYGGNIHGRIRFAVEVATALTEEIGPSRTGMRISPINTYNDMHDPDPESLYDALLTELSRLQLAYINVVEGNPGEPREVNWAFDFQSARRRFDGPWMVNNQYDGRLATAALQSGAADLIAFGRPFIANPDLVERLRHSLPLTAINKSTLYGGGEAGYTDYKPYL